MKKKKSKAVPVKNTEQEGEVFTAKVLGLSVVRNGKETFYPNPNLTKNKIVKNKKD